MDNVEAIKKGKSDLATSFLTFKRDTDWMIRGFSLDVEKYFDELKNPLLVTVAKACWLDELSQIIDPLQAALDIQPNEKLKGILCALYLAARERADIVTVRAYTKTPFDIDIGPPFGSSGLSIKIEAGKIIAGKRTDFILSYREHGHARDPNNKSLAVIRTNIVLFDCGFTKEDEQLTNFCKEIGIRVYRAKQKDVTDELYINAMRAITILMDRNLCTLGIDAE